jgi:hypothetical protein
MTLIMQHQNHAMQLRAIAAHDAGIKRRDQGLPIRRLPVLAPIAGHQRIQNQVRNDDLLVALVARTGRRVDLHFDRSRNRHLARDRLHERWQVSWLAGQRRTPIFPVAQ